MGERRLNIGFLVDDVDTAFTSSIIKGAIKASKELDANLYVFPGKYIEPDYRDKKMTTYNYQYNTLFAYAADCKLDVICILLGVIASTLNEKKQEEFLKMFGDIPVVCMCSQVNGYASVHFDNKIAFFKEIEHLIVEHGARKIGYVSGPKTNDDAIEREEIYRQVMKKYQIDVPEERVVYGDFSDYCTPIIEQLLDQNEKLDAIVFANDHMALAGYRVFAKRGLQAGKDIKVVGFDDETFALTMNPPLTTVKSNSVDLGYQAIYLANRCSKSKCIEEINVNSFTIVRKSCGCMEPGGKVLQQRLGIDDVKLCTNEDLRERIIHFLFDGCIAVSKDNKLVRLFAEFVDTVLSMRECTQETELLLSEIYYKFSLLFSQEILEIITTDRLFDMLRFMHYIMELDSNSVVSSVSLSELFYHMYRFVAEKVLALEVNNKEEINQMGHRINSFTRELVTFGENVDISYEMALETLKSMNMDSVYLYVFDEPKKHLDTEKWEIPEEIFLKAYYSDGEMVSVLEGEQRIATRDVLMNPYTNTAKRVVRILSPLFSGAQQYGLLLCELEPKYYSFLTPTISKLSSNIRTIFLLEQQKQIEERFEGHLRTAMKNNEYLENISKIDELTKVYNRRGFYENAKLFMEQPKFIGRKAVFVFGDLDELKMINDTYGHDAGDIAIKTIASVLMDAFSSAGIVGRFGGDEFFALLIVSMEEFKETYLPSFIHIKKAANQHLKKPYVVDMSLGYIEFEVQKGMSFNDLIEAADEQLYKEKKRKKNVTKGKV